METKTAAKITLGICVVLLVIVSAFFVTALQTKMSMEKAKEIAVAYIGGTIAETSYGTSSGKDVYYVETTDGTTETEVEIDAATGEILNTETESADDEDEIKISSSGAKISEEEAKEIAVAETGGKVTEVDTDRKNGRDAWEIEINKNGNYADVLVDMETGEVLAVEWEDEEDDD